MLDRPALQILIPSLEYFLPTANRSPVATSYAKMLFPGYDLKASEFSTDISNLNYNIEIGRDGSWYVFLHFRFYPPTKSHITH